LRPCILLMERKPPLHPVTRLWPVAMASRRRRRRRRRKEVFGGRGGAGTKLSC